MGRGAGGELGALGRPNPYSRAEWTELQLQFRPPRDGPVVSTRLRDYVTAEEIGVVVAALQLLRRELSVRARSQFLHCLIGRQQRSVCCRYASVMTWGDRSSRARHPTRMG
jgi:hypothetical protein